MFLDVSFPLDFKIDRLFESESLLGYFNFGDFAFLNSEPYETSDFIRLSLELFFSDGSFYFLRLLEFFLDLWVCFYSLCFEEACFLNFIYFDTFLLVLLDFFKLLSSRRFESEILIDFS